MMNINRQNFDQPPELSPQDDKRDLQNLFCGGTFAGFLVSRSNAESPASSKPIYGSEIESAVKALQTGRAPHRITSCVTQEYSAPWNDKGFKPPSLWEDRVKLLLSHMPDTEYACLILNNEKSTHTNLKKKWRAIIPVEPSRGLPSENDGSMAAWKKALEFAKWSSLCGHSFKSNFFMALMKLGRFEEALPIALECLQDAENQNFRNYMLRQTANCYLKLENPLDCIKCFMATKETMFKAMSYERIRLAMLKLSEAGSSNITPDVLTWFNSIRIDSCNLLQSEKIDWYDVFGESARNKGEDFDFSLSARQYNQALSVLKNKKSIAAACYVDTENWKKKWSDLLTEAVKFGVLDYRLNVYVAAAYIRLKKFDLAEQWLSKEVTTANIKDDIDYKREIYKQFGYLYYKLSKFEDSIFSYQFGIDPSQPIDFDDMMAISHAIKSCDCKKEVIDWYRRLKLSDDEYSSDTEDTDSSLSSKNYSATKLRREAPKQYASLIDDDRNKTRKNVVKYWGLIEERAQQIEQKGMSSDEIWKEGVEFAKWSAQFGYHFAFNLAKAKLKLGHFRESLMVARACLKRAKSDFKFVAHIYQCIGFINSMWGTNETCIHAYMDTCTLDLPNATIKIISIAMNGLIDKHIAGEANYFAEIQWYQRLPAVKFQDEKIERRPPTFSNAEYLQVKKDWDKLKNETLSVAQGSRLWQSRWYKALSFAAKMAVVDYRFNVRVATALIQSKQWDLAECWLLKQFSGPEITYDKIHKNFICKQLGFIYFNKEDYLKSVQYYMRGIYLSKHVTHSDCETVKAAIYNLQLKNACTQEILSWWSDLQRSVSGRNVSNRNVVPRQRSYDTHLASSSLNAEAHPFSPTAAKSH